MISSSVKSSWPVSSCRLIFDPFRVAVDLVYAFIDGETVCSDGGTLPVMKRRARPADSEACGSEFLVYFRDDATGECLQYDTSIH